MFRSKTMPLALLALGALLSSCSSTGTRVVTVPPGATLKHVKENLEWITPCDVSENILGDEIVISKEGYSTYRGTIEELPQIARGTYQLKLDPVR